MPVGSVGGGVYDGGWKGGDTEEITKERGTYDASATWLASLETQLAVQRTVAFTAAMAKQNVASMLMWWKTAGFVRGSNFP